MMKNIFGKKRNKIEKAGNILPVHLSRLTRPPSRIILFSLFILAVNSSCNQNAPVNTNTSIQNDIKKKVSYDVKGVVQFPDVSNTNSRFKIKATSNEISTAATVSLIYPSNHATNPNQTIATGLTNSSGEFTINPNGTFNPANGDVFILEASKRIGSSGKNIMTLRSYIRWNEPLGKFDGMTKTGIYINPTTTGLTIIDENDTSLIPSDTIGTIDVSGGISIPSDIGTLNSNSILQVSEVVNQVLGENRDPIASIKLVNNVYTIDRGYDVAKMIEAGQCDGCSTVGVDLSTIDLSQVDLSNIDLTGADLSNVNLSQVDLTYLDLSGANLSGKEGEMKDLTQNDLKGTNLSGANLSYTNLSGTAGTPPTLKDLTKTRLSGANFTGADLTYANLTKVNLFEAVFNKTIITNANLTGADLTGVDLSIIARPDLNSPPSETNRGNVTGVKFIDADQPSVPGANLTGANLSYLDLRTINSYATGLANTQVTGINLSNANLSGVDLSGKNLYAANLSGAVLQYGTTVNNPRLLNANLRNADLSNANISYFNLSNINFTNCDLSDATLYNSNLTGTNFTAANLNGANLNASIMSRVNFTSADLRNLKGFKNSIDCDFSYADMSGLDLSTKTFLKGTTSGSPGCKLIKTKFINTIFSNTMTGTNFTDAIMKEVDLSGTPSAPRSLKYTVFTRADLSGANLSYVDASGISSSYASFNGAYLFGANLSNSRFDYASFIGAKFDVYNTVGPDLSNSIFFHTDFYTATPQHLPTTARSGANFGLAVWTNGLVCDAGSMEGCYSMGVLQQ